MIEKQELAKLKDIHLPYPTGWWPLAPGWYLLLLLTLAVLSFLSYLIYRYIKNRKAKRQALKLLQNYQYEYQQNKNSQRSAMQISELLRRVALAYYPREEVASLKGEAWLAFLSKTSKKIDFKAISHLLLVLPYQPVREVELELLFSGAKRWIKQRRKPCSN